MAHAKNHDYHILEPSVLPFIGALVLLIVLLILMPEIALWLPEQMR